MTAPHPAAPRPSSTPIIAARVWVTEIGEGLAMELGLDEEVAHQLAVRLIRRVVDRAGAELGPSVVDEQEGRPVS